MSFSNLDYLYDHLPGRMRRADVDLFLKRFSSWFGSELDKVDATLDTFHERIAPATASEEFIEWWLFSLFGWDWFPAWFTLDLKRLFYAKIAQHYARRGTARGITEFLAAFGIKARVITSPQFYGEFTVGEDGWLLDGPLVVIVQIYPQAAALPEDLSFYGEWTTGESSIADPALVIGRFDLDALLRFQQPIGHNIYIEEIVA